MFQFSKVSDDEINPLTYYKKWIDWFASFGIKTEIRKVMRGYALFREGTDAISANDENKK